MTNDERTEDVNQPTISLASERARLLTELCNQFRLDAVYAFGSRAREAYDWLRGERERLSATASDLDIGVKTIRGKPLDISDTLNLIVALEDLFDAPRVDLVYLETADPFLTVNIIRGERLYARDDWEADGYILYLLRRAGDLAPFERERMEMILQGGQ